MICRSCKSEFEPIYRNGIIVSRLCVSCLSKKGKEKMKKKQVIDIRPYCIYCSNSGPPDNWMVKCSVNNEYNLLTWSCRIKRFEVDKKKYNEWEAK